MLKYILRRFLNYLVLLFVAVSLAFVLAGTNLNPRTMLIERELTTKSDVSYGQVVASVDERLYAWNINPQTPIWERYGVWLKNVVTQFDWGMSPTGASVNTEITNRVPLTLQLMFLGFFIGIIVGVALGAWMATKQYSIADRTLSILMMLLISTPSMVIGIVLQIIATAGNQRFGTQLNFIGPESLPPPDGFWPQFADRLEHLLLPTISMALGSIATYSRYQRNLMLDTLGSDYVRTARAKGLKYSTAVRRHALRTSLIPIATYFAFGLAGLFTGAAITEQIFGWQGMGRYSVLTIQQMDINGTVAVAAFSGAMTLIGAFLSDVLIAMIDPRVRVS